MKKIIKITSLLFLIFLLLAGWFYWYQWRPVKIRQDCWQYSSEQIEIERKKLLEDLVSDPNKNITEEKIQQFKSAMLKKGYPPKDIDEFIQFKLKTYREDVVEGKFDMFTEAVNFVYEDCLKMKGLSK